MATVALFHSALGLRPSVEALAEQLRAAGHDVHTPDLYEGRVFDDLTDGVAYRDRLGIAELSARAQAAVAALPTDIVYAGLSMGAAAATFLALTRPGARGLVALHAAPPTEPLEGRPWPATLPVLVHRSLEDPRIEPDFIDALHRVVPADLLEEHVHPGTAHLFTDHDSEEYVAEHADATVRSVIGFVDRVARRRDHVSQ